MDDTKEKAWQRRCQQLDALGVDAYTAVVLPDDPRHAQVQAILLEYDIATGRVVPLPPGWEGLPPDRAIRDLDGLAKWLSEQWTMANMTKRGGQRFQGMALEKVTLAVRNGFRVLAWLGVQERPERPLPPGNLEQAMDQLDELEFWVRGKHTDGWRPAPCPAGAASATREQSNPAAEGQGERRMAVVLQGRDKPPLVRGEPQERLTRKQYAVVEALLAAGEKGLGKDDLSSNSKCGDALGILTRLKKSPVWASVIQMAGQTGRGYRILAE